MGHRHLFVLSLGLALVLVIAGAITQGMDDDGVGSMNMMRSMVGSRPPSCAGRCWWCGGGRRCEAVQVPITPQQRDKSRRHAHGTSDEGGSREASSSSSAAQYQHQHHQRRPSSTSAYDDRSNYKPLSWRCKCGGG